MVNKVDPEIVLSGSLGKLRGNQLIWNPRALAEAISKGNTSMHDMVIVYCRGKGNLSKAEEFALQLMRSESKNQVLEIIDQRLAETLNMEPEKFYAYYSPSALNTDHNLAGMEINTALLQVYEGLCKEEYSLKTERAEEILEANKSNFIKMDNA